MRILLLCFAILAGWSVFAGREENGLEEFDTEEGKLNWMETMDWRTKRTSDGKKTKEMSKKKTLGKQKSSKRKDSMETSRAKNNNKRFIPKNENKKKTNKINKGQKKTKKKIQNEKKKKTNKRNKGRKKTKKKNQEQNKKSNRNKSKQQQVKGKVKGKKIKSKTELKLRRTINKLRKTISKMSGNRKKKNLCRQSIDPKCEFIELQGSKFSTIAENYIRRFKRGTKNSNVVGKKKAKSSIDNIFGIAAQKIEDIVIYPDSPKCSRNANESAKNDIKETYLTLKKCNETVSSACSSTTNKRLLLPASTCSEILLEFKKEMDICRNSSIHDTTQKRCDCTSNLNNQVTLQIGDFKTFKNCTNKKTGDVIVFENQNKAQRNVCLKNFVACKQAEDRSAALLEACVGGKPENTDPNTVSIGQIRRGINNRRDGSVRSIEMDVFENTQFFTQTTTYYELGDYVEITVPKHGYPPYDIIASNTYYLKTGTNDTIFDTQIIKTENGSYLSEISIEKADILNTIDIVVGSNRMEVQSNSITTEKSQAKLIIPRKLDEIEKKKLPQLVQDLVKNTDVFTYSTYEVSEEEITTLNLIQETYPNMYIIKNYTEMEDDAFGTPTGYGFSARNALETIGPYGRNRQVERQSDCNGALGDIIYERTQRQCNYAYITYTKPNGQNFTISVNHNMAGIPKYPNGTVQCCGNINRPITPAKCYCNEASKCFGG